MPVPVLVARTRITLRFGAALMAVAALTLVGCSGGDDRADAANPATSSPSPNSSAAGDPTSPPATPAAEAPGTATSESPRPDAGGGPGSPAGTAAEAAPTAPSGAARAGRPGTPAAASPARSAPGVGSGSGKSAAPPPAAPTPGDTPGAANPGKANYASDVGVSADTIRIGAINLTSATRSLGPAIAGVQEQNLDAAVKYINRTGGVSGRKLQLVTCDDGGDVARARSCYEKLKGNVFAFVPSITWLTDVIHDRLVKDKVPWLSWGWFKSEYEDPWMFPCHANGLREASAASDWVAKVIKPKTVGIMYLNVSEDIAAKDMATRQLQKYGIRVVQTVAQEWDSPDESQHVLAMRTANPDLVMSFSWPSPVAKFMHDASNQRWSPKLGYIANHLTADPGYGPVFGEYIKDRFYTITSWGAPTAPDPNNPEGFTPEQKLLQEELLRTNGREYQGFKWRYAGMHHSTQSGWVCTRILAKAAAALGADLTREGFKRALESRPWDSGLGVTLYWPATGHNDEPYSYNREFIYKWITAADGGWDQKRILPDPVYNCQGLNIPPDAKTHCTL